MGWHSTEIILFSVNLLRQGAGEAFFVYTTTRQDSIARRGVAWEMCCALCSIFRKHSIAKRGGGGVDRCPFTHTSPLPFLFCCETVASLSLKDLKRRKGSVELGCSFIYQELFALLAPVGKNRRDSENSQMAAQSSLVGRDLGHGRAPRCSSGWNGGGGLKTHT